jgi:hypothetical protein
LTVWRLSPAVEQTDDTVEREERGKLHRKHYRCFTQKELRDLQDAHIRQANEFLNVRRAGPGLDVAVKLAMKRRRVWVCDVHLSFSHDLHRVRDGAG